MRNLAIYENDVTSIVHLICPIVPVSPSSGFSNATSKFPVIKLNRLSDFSNINMVKQNFSITVILRAYFGDFREQAKLFIDEDVKTVSDLQKKIMRIFHIQNFHLVLDDHYLPPSEDIRVLQEGNCVRVVPHKSISMVNCLEDEYYSCETFTPETKKNVSFDLNSPIKKKRIKCLVDNKLTSYPKDGKSKDEYEGLESKNKTKKTTEYQTSTPLEKEEPKKIFTKPKKDKREIEDINKVELCSKKTEQKRNVNAENIINKATRQMENLMEQSYFTDITEPRIMEVDNSASVPVVKQYLKNDLPNRPSTSLQVKRKNNVIWCNVPPYKTNHVKINKVPIEKIDLDLSNFVIDPLNMGVIPVPESSTTVYPEFTDTKVTYQVTPLLNMPEPPCTTQAASPPKEKNISCVRELEHTNCEGDQLVRKKEEELKRWRKSIFSKLKDRTTDPHVLNANLVQETTPTIKTDEKKGVASYLKKRKPDVGLNHFIKLLEKIDWDVTKSICDVNDTENKKEELKKVETADDTVDDELSSLSSWTTVDGGKRKRKRKHKKKVQIAASEPVHLLECPRPLIKTGSPLLHIRFDENIETSDDWLNTQDGPKEKVKILHNVPVESNLEESSSTTDLNNINPGMSESEERLAEAKAQLLAAFQLPPDAIDME